MVKYSKYTLKNGKERWKYSGYYGVDPKTGDRIRPKKSGFKTKADAKLHYERAVENLNNNTVTKQRIKFNDLYAEFLKFYAHTGVTDSTQVKFQADTNKHVVPYFGRYYVDTITVSDCQKFVSGVKKKRKDFRKMIGHARAIFNYGVQEGYLSESPLNKVIVTSSKEQYTPKRIAPTDNVYTPEQLTTFLDYYRDHGEFYQYVYFRLLAFTGLRRGEALALLKTDINKKDKSIRINKTLAEGANNKTVVANHTKTDSGDFIIYLDNHTFELLEELMQQSVFKLANNTYIEILDSDYLFTSPKSHSHFHRQAPNEWLSKFWRKHEKQLTNLGLHKISPHGFRHSQATLLYELGVDAKDAQHRLRHKNLKTTMDVYTHISQNRKLNIVTELNTFSATRDKNRAKIISFPNKIS